MKKSFGFGIVGCGAISKAHIESIKLIPEARLVGVVDKFVEKAKAVGEGEGCDYYSDYNDLLKRPDLDIVCVCTPSGLHAEPTIASAKAGKHVIVEKPLEITLEKIDSMIKACEENNVKLATIFPNRFKKATNYLWKKVQDGRFGKLIMGDAYIKWYRTPEYYSTASWRGTWTMDGGGALMNQSIHTIDLLQWMMGKVSSVVAYTDALLHDIETEDTAVAIVRFENGALGVIEGATSLYPGFPNRLEIHGSKGAAILENEKFTTWNFIDSDEQEENEIKRLSEAANKSTSFSDPMAFNFDPHRRQIEDMIAAIKEDRAPFIDGYEGRKAVEIIASIYRSSKEGRPVDL